MKSYLIILGNEPELVALATVIDKKYCESKADVVMYNDLGNADKSDQVFLIGHADIKTIDQYSADDLRKGDFNDFLKATQTIFLAGCSTADEAQKIVDNGFVPLTIAQNLKQFYSDKKVYGTPGVLILNTKTGQLSVDLTRDAIASGIRPGTLWVEQ